MGGADAVPDTGDSTNSLGFTLKDCYCFELPNSTTP